MEKSVNAIINAFMAAIIMMIMVAGAAFFTILSDCLLNFVR